MSTAPACFLNLAASCARRADKMLAKGDIAGAAKQNALADHWHRVFEEHTGAR